MDSKQYIADAIKTESVPASLVINELALHGVIELSTEVAGVADQFKRKLFYGKDMNLPDLARKLQYVQAVAGYLSGAIEAHADFNSRLSSDDLEDSLRGADPRIQDISLDNIDIRLLHCALGCFTESGELLEAIQKQYESNGLDKVNFGEEVGDIEWYQAIGFDASGVSEASCREKNIAKLKKRYPDKFSAEAAINRDVAAERAVLEQDLVPQ